MKTILFGVLLGFIFLCQGEELPSVYEFYTGGGPIESGLVAAKDGFFLNGKNITIQSGAMHYFRIPPQYWRDRLRKLRASGLIAVETYVPWNLHEPEKDVFDFGDGGRDMSDFLNLVTFLKLAQEEDLLVLLRPGPYICGEWEMGGLPSWLLRIPGIVMRTSEPQYQQRADVYMKEVLSRVVDLQFTRGGPIIAFQVENEYSSVGYTAGPDQQHLINIKELMRSNGVVELLYTSDNVIASEKGTLPGELRTSNFQDNVLLMLAALKQKQPDKPAMVMEFWTGWFDHWMNEPTHLKFPPAKYADHLEKIIKFPASFNLYMFHGGTNFAFLNGANGEVQNMKSFDVTSYDYDAPLSEAGDYTEKYNITANLVAQYASTKFCNPERPPETEKVAYGSTNISAYLKLSSVYDAAEPKILQSTVQSMESLAINNDNGQSYGYIWYRAKDLSIKEGSVLKISGLVHDWAQVYVDGVLQTKVLDSDVDTSDFGFWSKRDAELTLTTAGTTLDIIVENMGRINFMAVTYSEQKGLYEGPVLLDGGEVDLWDIAALEFKKNWTLGLQALQWEPFQSTSEEVRPGLYRATLQVDGEPKDTFIDMREWVKGIVLVNGFNVGRYNKLGPQKALFLPAPLLRSGSNEIIIYEQFRPAHRLVFSSQHILL